MLESRLENARRNRQIEQSVSLLHWRTRLDLREPLLDVHIGVVFREISACVKRPLAEPLPDVVVDLVDLVGVGHRFAHYRAITLIGVLITRYAQQREVVGQKLLLSQVIDGWNELALGEVARATEDHHCARVSLVAVSAFSRRAHQRNGNRSSHDFFTA